MRMLILIGVLSASTAACGGKAKPTAEPTAAPAPDALVAAPEVVTEPATLATTTAEPDTVAAPPTLTTTPVLFATEEARVITFHHLLADGDARPSLTGREGSMSYQAEGAHVTLEADVSAWSWLDNPTLVVLLDDGAVVRVRGATVTPITLPARAAWKPMKPVEPDADMHTDPEALSDLAELAVVAGAVWKSECVAAGSNEGLQCLARVWLRIEPLDAEHPLAELPGHPWAGFDAPAVEAPTDVTLKSIVRAQAPPGGDRPELNWVTCEDGTRTMHFPKRGEEAGQAGQAELYGGEVFDAMDPVWLWAAPPLWMVDAVAPGLDERRVQYAFEGCADQPIGASAVTVVAGPPGWIAFRPEEGQSGWHLYRNGSPSDLLAAARLSFAPLP